jgi:hypothetical protein
VIEGHLSGRTEGWTPKGSSGLEMAAVPRGGAVGKSACARWAGVGIGRPDQCLWGERSDGLLGDGPGRLFPRLLAGRGPALGGFAWADPMELNGDPRGQPVDGLRELRRGGEEAEVVRTLVPQTPLKRVMARTASLLCLAGRTRPGRGKARREEDQKSVASRASGSREGKLGPLSA